MNTTDVRALMEHVFAGCPDDWYCCSDSVNPLILSDQIGSEVDQYWQIKCVWGSLKDPVIRIEWFTSASGKIVISWLGPETLNGFKMIGSQTWTVDICRPDFDEFIWCVIADPAANPGEFLSRPLIDLSEYINAEPKMVPNYVTNPINQNYFKQIEINNNFQKEYTHLYRPDTSQNFSRLVK